MSERVGKCERWSKSRLSLSKSVNVFPPLQENDLHYDIPHVVLGEGSLGKVRVGVNSSFLVMCVTVRVYFCVGARMLAYECAVCCCLNACVNAGVCVCACVHAFVCVHACWSVVHTRGHVRSSSKKA